MAALPDKAYPVSWDQFHRDARALAWRLMGPNSKEDVSWKAIVCITRGGLVPATIVARELGIRVVESVSVKSYSHQSQTAKVEILKPICDEILEMGKNTGEVLIIDDLVDTGATAKAVRDMLPKAHFATVYAKPMGHPVVDTFVTEVSQDTWIYFPWDMDFSYAPPIRDGADE